MKAINYFLLSIFAILLFSSTVSADNLYYINQFDLQETVKSMEYVDVGSINGYVYSNATSYTCLMNHTDLTVISCNTVQQLTMSDHSLYLNKFAHIRPTDNLLFSADLTGAGTGSYGTGAVNSGYIVFSNDSSTWTANATHFKEMPTGVVTSWPADMKNNIERCDWYSNGLVCLGGGDLRTVYQTDMNGTLLNSFRLEISGSLKDDPIDIHGTGDVIQIVTAQRVYLFAISSIILDRDLTLETDLLDGDLSPQQKILVTVGVAFLIIVIMAILGYVENMPKVMIFLSSLLVVGWLITASVLGFIPAWVLIVMLVISAGVLAMALKTASHGG